MPGSKDMDLAKLAAQNRMKQATKQIESIKPLAPQPNAPESSKQSEKLQISRRSSGTSGLPAGFKPPTLKQLLGRLDTERTELAKRKHLSKGIRADGKACDIHVNGLRALKEIQDRGDGAKLKLILAKDPTVMDVTIFGDTALMPLCYKCFVKETGHAHGNSLPDLDQCQCATSISDAECVYCAVGKLEQKKLVATKDRTRMTTQGLNVVVCQCGSIVQGTGKARKCAGCNGIVAEPFSNFAGEAVAFLPRSAAVEQKDQAKSSSEKSYEGILDTPTPALLKNSMTGTLIQTENDPWLLEEVLDRKTPARIEERKAHYRLEYRKSVATLADQVMLPSLRLRDFEHGLKRGGKGINMEGLKSVWRTCGFGKVDRDRFEDFVKRRRAGEVGSRDLVVIEKAAMKGT